MGNQSKAWYDYDSFKFPTAQNKKIMDFFKCKLHYCHTK